MASGARTKRFGSTSRMPFPAAQSLVHRRFTSCAFAFGVRFPMLLTQRIRLSRARLRMMCVFDSGSPSQSFEKTTMSRPDSLGCSRSSMRRMLAALPLSLTVDALLDAQLRGGCAAQPAALVGWSCPGELRELPVEAEQEGPSVRVLG